MSLKGTSNPIEFDSSVDASSLYLTGRMTWGIVRDKWWCDTGNDFDEWVVAKLDHKKRIVSIEVLSARRLLCFGEERPFFDLIYRTKEDALFIAIQGRPISDATQRFPTGDIDGLPLLTVCVDDKKCIVGFEILRAKRLMRPDALRAARKEERIP